MRDTAAMMRQLGATYLLDSGRPERLRTPTQFAEGPQLHKVFENRRAAHLAGGDGS